MALLHIFKILKHYYFSRAGVSPNGDASTILNYLSTLVSVAQFDALSPYHPTSEGILAKLMKRPYHERSMENKNIAAIFAGRLLIQTVLMVSYTLNPVWHGGDTFIPISSMSQILSANFPLKISKLFCR